MHLLLLRKTSFYRNLVKKAALFVAAFLLVSSNSNAASELNPSSVAKENYKDLIEKAQNLVLQKDRLQALNLLDQSLKQEQTKTTSAGEIKKQMSSMARIFLVEKAQQSYELALSLRRQDPAQALARTRDGLKLEPDNLSLIIEESRLLLQKGECAGAQDSSAKIHHGLFGDEEVQLLSAQMNICNHEKEITNLTLKSSGAIVRSSSLRNFWGLVDLESAWIEKNDIKGRQILKELIAGNFKHPELLYWQFQFAVKHEPNKQSWGQKYILSCQNLTKRQQREYLVDPYLCLRTTEIDLELKKIGASNEK